MFRVVFALFFLFPLSLMAQQQQKIKAVVFDFGGVIAKQDRQATLQFFSETFHLTGQELRSALKEWKQVLENGEDEKEFWEHYAKSHGILLPENWDEDYERAIGFKDIPGMIDLVNTLQANGYQTPLLSNIALYQANVVRKFDYYNLFDPVLLSYEIGVEKPDLRAYSILLNRLRLQPEEVVFIDDQLENVEAAREAGIDSIQFHSTEELKEELLQRKIHFQDYPSMGILK